MPSNILPINRFYDQLAHNFHVSFKKKWRELVMQIYGHEALVAEKDLSDIAHCTVLDIDIYRLNSIRWEHLALRKLANPFKLFEFLTVVPLEFFNWIFLRLRANLEPHVRFKKNNLRANLKASFYSFCIICLA